MPAASPVDPRLDRRSWEHSLEGNLLLEGQTADVLARAAALDAIVIFHGWRTKDVKNERELVVVILAREERLAVEHLSQDATNTPHVDSLGVLLECEHDLGCTVPACGYIFGHEARVVLGAGSRTRKTEIADFQIAVGIKEKIRGL